MELLLGHARRQRNEVHLHVRQLLVKPLNGCLRDVDVDRAHHNGIAVDEEVRAALRHDALEDRSERLLYLLARLQEAALDQALLLLRLALKRGLARLEIMHLLRLHVGREDRDLLLQCLTLRAQGVAFAFQVVLGLNRISLHLLDDRLAHGRAPQDRGAIDHEDFRLGDALLRRGARRGGRRKRNRGKSEHAGNERCAAGAMKVSHS